MSGWAEFAAALAAFLLSHALPVRPPLRPWLVARLGLRGYMAGYSLLSLALLAWLIGAAARAPYLPLLPPLQALRWVPLVVMVPVCLLVPAGLMIRNPLSFGGIGRRRFDPDRPGILALTRHPLLLALMLWAAAHLLANGDLVHVILFGLFAGFAAAGMGLIDRRNQRLMGRATWHGLARNTALVSLRGLARLRPAPLPVVAAAGLYGALLALHLPVIGVSPWP